MAKQQKDPINYSAEIKRLRSEGPQRMYVLYGEEDYLREQYFEELKKLCVEPGNEEFNFRRIDSATVKTPELAEAIDAVPFFSEHTFVELRGLDINQYKEQSAEEFLKIAADIPDYCTVAIILPNGSTPDGRTSFVKKLKKISVFLEFTKQDGSALQNWIIRRFGSMGKNIGRTEADHLVFTSGNLMNGLIPEIEKISQYCHSDTVTKADIDAVAHHLPDAKVFDMTDRLSRGDNDGAMSILSELLQMKSEHPIKINAIVGMQMRNLYAARLSIDNRLGKSYVKEVTNRNDYSAEQFISCARRFTVERLRHAVMLCADYDYAMKSSSADDNELMRELVLRLAVGK